MTTPDTPQAALRDRIAEALLTTRRTDYEGTADHRNHRYDARCALCAYDVDALADAVLAALPAPVDRGAVLREEAARIRAHCPDHLDDNSNEGSWMNCHCDVADDMERRAAAAEARATAPDTESACSQCGHSQARHMGDDHQRGCHACWDSPGNSGWFHRFHSLSATPPAAEMQQDGEQTT